MSDEIAAQMSFECPDCHGLIEMPVPATPPDQLQCPHCGYLMPSRPVSPKLSAKAIALLIAVLLLLGVAGFATAVALKHGARPRSAPRVAEGPAVVSVSTNQFTVSSLGLEKQGALRYVQGTARNDLPRQRFGVTIRFSLLDTNELQVGLASDYRAVVQSNEVWRFRALAVEPGAASAAVIGIQEDQ